MSAAVAQLPDGAAAMHSLNAGMVIHREAQVHHDYLPEARAFAIQLQNDMNMKLCPDAVTLVYEEVFGRHGKMHWLVHMKTPSAYGRSSTWSITTRRSRISIRKTVCPSEAVATVSGSSSRAASAST
nr:DUF6039 family protein [Burkholderia ubonensis]